MFRHDLKIALRRIGMHKVYSLINMAGLTIGLACCLLITLFVRDELAFDRYHEKADRIFRLIDGFDVEGDQGRFLALTSAPFSPALKREFPQVEDAVRFFPARNRLVAFGESKSYENDLFFVDPSVFDVFSFPLVRGDAAMALVGPNAVVLSERLAAKYFGRDEPIHKLLKVNDQEFLVTGVMKDMPRQSHFRAEMLASLSTLEKIPSVRQRYLENWVRHEFYTYLLLKDAEAAATVEAQLPAFIERHAAADIKAVLGGRLSSRLQPLTEIHLRSHLQHELGANGDIKYVTVFSVIAVLILLIACVNFMNLSTARSASRSREVGLRKVVGASRSRLVRQFLGESYLFTAFALILALVVAALALPAFNALSGKALRLRDMLNPSIAGFLLVAWAVVGFISGSYPAFFLSAFRPAGVLKKPGKTAAGRAALRRALVVGQFGVSIVLIISTAVVADQLEFLRERKLGFDKEHLIVIPVRDNSIRSNPEAVKADLGRNPSVLAATLTIGVPGGVVAGDSLDIVTEQGKKRVTVRMIYTDHDFIRVLGMEVVQGRDFSRDMITDAGEAFIINEAAVRGLGLRDPLETRFEWDEKKGRVIGVVRDFQFQSLREEITPLVIQISPRNALVMAVRIRPDRIQDTLAYIEKIWTKYDPSHPFEFSFMDQTFDAIYRGEEKLGRIYSLAAVLAVFIASLGLFGLALFMIEERTKEIAIRKVLGASQEKIAVLLSREFALLVLLANVAAWPAAYALMKRWLLNFAYRVEIQPRFFVFAAGAAFLVALLTIVFQTMRAAGADPIKALKHE